MKKTLALLLLLLAVLTSGALAEEETTADDSSAPENTAPGKVIDILAGPEIKPVDLALLEASSFYSYDKFDKEWELSAKWQNDYGPENGIIALSLSWSSKSYENHWPPLWRVCYYDYANKHYNEMRSFQIIIGEKLYTFGKLAFENGAGYCYGGHKLRSMLDDLQTAETIDFRLVYVNAGGAAWEATVADFKVSPEWNGIVELGRTLREANVWDNTHILMLSSYDIGYGAEIE